MDTEKKLIKYLVVDTTAFIQNAPLQNVAENIITCQEVVNEIKSKRQLRRLVVLPYDLKIKDVFPENIKIITDVSKKTGDYLSLSATDIKLMALTYQLEKEKVGTDHLKFEPEIKTVILNNPKENMTSSDNTPTTGFFSSNNKQQENLQKKDNEELKEKLNSLNISEEEEDDDDDDDDKEEIINKDCNENNDDDDDDDNNGSWITPSNIKLAKEQLKSDMLMEKKNVIVACMTTDFAIQNILKQMNLNVAALDGRIIKELKTFVLRCYTCFKITSKMDKEFCPKCGNKTVKKVAVSLNDKGEMQIHINLKKPLTGRGKKFSLPRMRGGKHSNNPILVADQPMPDNRPSKLATKKNNPLDDDYIAGFSPFLMRDVNSKSAILKSVQAGKQIKYWMRKNPNESGKRHK